MTESLILRTEEKFEATKTHYFFKKWPSGIVQFQWNVTKRDKMLFWYPIRVCWCLVLIYQVDVGRVIHQKHQILLIFMLFGKIRLAAILDLWDRKTRQNVLVYTLVYSPTLRHNILCLSRLSFIWLHFSLKIIIFSKSDPPGIVQFQWNVTKRDKMLFWYPMRVCWCLVFISHVDVGLEN